MATARPHDTEIEVKIFCELCNTSHQVNTYCKECCSNICDNCKEIHIGLHKSHNVVPVFEGRLENIRLKVQCSKHEQRFLFYCKKCDLNICQECLVAEHNGHEVENVSKHSHTLKQNLNTKINTKKYYHTEIKRGLKTVEEHEKMFQKLIKKQKDSVHREVENKQKRLKADGDKIIKNLESEEGNGCKIIREHYQKIKNIDTDLNNLIESLSNTLTNIPDAAVFNFVQESESKLEIITNDMTFDLPNPPIFAPSNPGDQGSSLIGVLKSSSATRLSIKSHMIQSIPANPSSSASSVLFSNIKTPSDPPQSLRCDLQVITKFSPAIGDCITDLCSTADDLFWVGTSGYSLFLVDKAGDIKSRIKMPGHPCHISVTCLGDAIVSTYSHVIYHVTRQGDISTFVDVSPDKVYGITTTRQGDVFACVDTGSMCTVKKYTAEGDFVLEVDTDLFTTRHQGLVHCVTDDTVCIQDGLPGADDECTLTFVDGAGQLVSRVTRPKQLSDYTKSMLWDRHGHIVTGTVDDEYIHVFSGDGTYRQSYHVEGSTDIMGLCLGNGDIMLIGTGKGIVIVAKYLQ